MPHAIEHLAHKRLVGLIGTGTCADAPQACGSCPVHTNSAPVVPFPAMALHVPVRPKPECVVGPRLRQLSFFDGSVDGCLQRVLLGFCLGHRKAAIIMAHLASVDGVAVACKHIAMDTVRRPGRCGRRRHCRGAAHSSCRATPILLRCGPPVFPIGRPCVAVEGAPYLSVHATPLFLGGGPPTFPIERARIAIEGLGCISLVHCCGVWRRPVAR